jgi:acyl dehydratase
MSRTYFDDLAVGWRSRVGTWRLDEDEVIAFARQWDPQPFHVDRVAAEASMFGGLTASSLHLFAICTRLFFDHDAHIAVLAMLGKDSVRFPNPARVGERLVYETECIEHRPSTSKPDRGVIRLRDEVTDSAGRCVLSQDVSLLVARRSGPPVTAR